MRCRGEAPLTAFVILPFVERDPKHAPGFFAEVLRSLITPAAKENFIVKTANRQGSDMIQSIIVNDLIEALRSSQPGAPWTPHREY
jgi:hypothetical protein